MNTAVDKAADRLESVLASEIEALRSGNAVNLAEITSRKNQCLLEFSRLARTLPDTDPALRRRLEGLKLSVEENQRVLDMHIRASREIAALITRTIAEAESDGTYSARTVRRGAPA
ncbi:hypothetical protein [Aurantimonas sp. VKM B-3413]|uniref:hypothetical protein n=1 Tax=Aurantimonas sp. VKM B-3413 TaxID=2779401 RepID=UPI001E43FA97|nr:hypothetical protein [Aurantimonas sp. VKM B-3413]MCB8838123.1 hypothetical protein [Aurantimonas sp. VKM B-3413]